MPGTVVGWAGQEEKLSGLGGSRTPGSSLSGKGGQCFWILPRGR